MCLARPLNLILNFPPEAPRLPIVRCPNHVPTLSELASVHAREIGAKQVQELSKRPVVLETGLLPSCLRACGLAGLPSHKVKAIPAQWCLLGRMSAMFSQCYLRLPKVGMYTRGVFGWVADPGRSNTFGHDDGDHTHPPRASSKESGTHQGRASRAADTARHRFATEGYVGMNGR